MERIAIEIKNANKEISKKKALDNINLTVHASEIAAIVGPKGSGKSLLTKVLVSMSKFDNGEIKFFDHNIKKERDYIMNFVGYKVKEFVPWKNITVLEYFKYSSKFYQGDFLPNALELINYFHLNKDAKLKSLDKESLAKISIIDSLFFDPEVVIMDEPMAYLSKDSQDLLVNLLYNLKKKSRAILITSGDLNEVSFSDTTYYMKNGKLLTSEDLPQINKNYKHVVIKTKKEISEDVFKGSKFKNLVFSETNISFTYQGDINDLINLLERLSLVDITITNPSLEEIYLVLDESNILWVN